MISENIPTYFLLDTIGSCADYCMKEQFPFFFSFYCDNWDEENNKEIEVFD